MQPEQDDFYDIDVFNENFEKIDAILQTLQELAQPREKKLAAAFFGSGIFRPADWGLQGAAVDIYMVGGGGGGGGLSRGGGGGGYCKLIRNFVLTEESYPIVIGAGGIGGTSVAAGAAGAVGGNTIAFGETVAGGLGAAGMAGGRGGSGGGASPGGNGGERGSGGGGGGVNANTDGAAGAGNIEFCPTNPYDGICYGSGGGGGCGRGGGSGGPIFANGIASRNGSLGGGGAGGTSVSGGMLGGQGGLGGGGGGGSHHQTSGAGGAGGNGLIYIYAVPKEIGG